MSQEIPGEELEQELEQEYLGEFELEGDEKEQYLSNLDDGLRLLSRSDIDAKDELLNIRAFHEVLGENTDSLFERISFDREDSGFPTYWQVITLLSQKRNVLKKLDSINGKIEHQLSSRAFTGEPCPQDRGTLSVLLNKKMERNAELLSDYTQKSLLDMLNGRGRALETVEDLASLRGKAVFYADLFQGEHLVDADVKQSMQKKEGEIPAPWTLMQIRLKKRDWNAKFVKWHASVGAFDSGYGLFFKYSIDLCVKTPAVGKYIAPGGKPTRELTNLLELYAGFEPEDIYDILLKHKDIDPVDVSLVTIGPFYSGPYAHSEGMVSESLLEKIRENPEEFLLMSTVRTVRRARRDLGSIFYSKPLFGEDQSSERTARLPVTTSSYFVTSPGLEPRIREILDAAAEEGDDTMQLYDHGGGNFVQIR